MTDSQKNLIRKYLSWEKNMKKVLPMHKCMTNRRNLYHGGEVVEFTEKCNEVDNCKKHENCECPIKVKLTCGREVIVPMYDFEFCESHEEISCKQCRAVLRERAYELEKALAKWEKEK